MALFFFWKAKHFIGRDRIIWDVKDFKLTLAAMPENSSRGAVKREKSSCKKNYCISPR